MQINIIDTHSHLNEKIFYDDIEEIVKRCMNNNIYVAITASSTESDFEKNVKLSERFDILYYLVGIHPHYAHNTKNETYDKAIKYLHNDKCLGIGEIGLDFYYNFSEKNTQNYVFSNFLDIAIQYDVPVSIHSRDATKDIIDILKTKKSLKGVLHCFSGDEQLFTFINNDTDLYFGIGGLLTFKNSPLEPTIRKIPLERIVLETDAPFLTPEPFRGKRNEPLYIKYVLNKLAVLLNKNVEEIAQKIFLNSKRIFKIT